MKRKPRTELDELVRRYADSERSDTFVSYNDAIVLARAVRRLRARVRLLERHVATLEDIIRRERRVAAASNEGV